jgi:hypothetical protein
MNNKQTSFNLIKRCVERAQRGGVFDLSEVPQIIDALGCIEGKLQETTYKEAQETAATGTKRFSEHKVAPTVPVLPPPPAAKKRRLRKSVRKKAPAAASAASKELPNVTYDQSTRYSLTSNSESSSSAASAASDSD